MLISNNNYCCIHLFQDIKVQSLVTRPQEYCCCFLTDLNFHRGQTESSPSNYCKGGSTCIMTSMYWVKMYSITFTYLKNIVKMYFLILILYWQMNWIVYYTVTMVLHWPLLLQHKLTILLTLIHYYSLLLWHFTSPFYSDILLAPFTLTLY